MDYKQLDASMQKRCSQRRKLANNTYAERRGETIAVRLHSTDILAFYPDGRIEVNTGGWDTVTTRDRINRYLPPPWKVWGYRNHTVLGKMWKDGVEIDPCATITPRGAIKGGRRTYAELAADVREEDNERNRPRNRARYWLRKARGIYVDRSLCQAEQRWDCSVRRSRRRHGGLSTRDLGMHKCGCRVYHEPSVYNGTVASILEEGNMTVRAAKMQCYGVDRFFLDARARTIDEQAGYQLLEIPSGRQWVDGMRAVQMECPSTGQIYINPVPPNVSTVAEALDWIFNTKDYLQTVTQQT